MNQTEKNRPIKNVKKMYLYKEVNYMTHKHSIGNRITSVLLVIAILFTMIPMVAMVATAANVNGNRIADPSTMDSWKEFFPISGEISTENAGGVWMDKSIFTDTSAFAGLGITQDDPESFLVALSAMAANMSITGMSHVPTDSILVLDVSGSMNNDRGNNDVAEELVQAANASIKALLETNSYNRVGVVLYSGSSSSNNNYTTGAVVLLPLDRYTTGSDGRYLNYTLWNSSEIISLDSDLRIEGTNTAPNAVSKEVVGATYMQRGIITALNQFLAAENSVVVNGQRRTPVLVLMSDGAPSLGSTNFTDPGYNQNRGYNMGNGSGTSAALGFVSQLSAAYAKAKMEEKYGTDALFYTLGLGLSNDDDIAIGVMDPTNSDANTALNDFWNDVQTNWRGQVTFEGYNLVDVGETVSLGSGYSVTKIATPLEQNYVDQYFAATGSSGDLAAELAKAFEEIVGAIQLQSSYYPTLVFESEDLSGYISFVDKIGQYMKVTDIKGIVIDNQLFSGADLASNFVSDGGALGTWNNPSALGLEMVAAVRARLGLESDEVAATLIGLAYENGQLSYTDANNYSNYIGWYANAAGEFLGFYNEGTTVLPAATGNAATDPAFVIRSYGYLGAVDESHGVSESDMMYATVQVRKEIATGEELVTFAVPAALIPTITYNVTLDEEDKLSDLTVSGAQNPIRLVYEVALDEEINSFNVKEIVSAEYLNDPHNVNADGTINFYTNQWDHENKTGYGTVNTYSYFNPSRQNDKYYYLEDTPVYSNANGTLYTGTAQPDASKTFYRSYQVYKNNGSLRTETVYAEIPDAVKATTVQKNDGSWYIPKGNVHVDLDGHSIHKSNNLTGTLTESSIMFVDTHNHSINDLGYQFYVGATHGNNGKLTVIPETGIKLSKTMADGVADPGDAFVFDIYNTTDTADGSIYSAWLIKADGTKVDTSVYFDDGNATVELNAGDVLYIGGMTPGETFRIVERESVAYVATATGLSQTGTVTANQNEIIPIAFVNDERGTGNLTIAKEIEHNFGVEYQIPADKLFTMQVTLSGIGTANSTFKAEHTNGTYTQITTDENGQFQISLAHDQQFEVFDLPAGTKAVVVEKNPETGFTPAYWDNGVIGDGTVTVVDDSTVSVIVVNDYEAAEVYPVSVAVSGNKHLTGANWQQGYSFDFKLEKLLPDGSWQQLGDIETASYGNTVFNFSDAFTNERYTAPGSYYYRIVEIEPVTPLGGFTYDKTVHSFAVHVGDVNMDGQLEITKVVSDRPNTTVVTETANGWNVNANFTNTYSTSGSATVTIDVTKSITNLGGADKSLAGYTFGLFHAQTGEQVATLTTTERGFARFVLNYDADEMNASTETFPYILKEIAPNPVPAGWNYSAEEIAVTVEVKDDGDGTISAVIYTGNVKPTNAGTSIAATFTNTYDPVDAELTIDFVNKELSGRDLNNGEFSFEVHSVDLQTMNTTKVLEGKNTADGRVVFDKTLKYDEVGSYYYWIMETSSDDKGVVTDKTTYRVIVTVTDNDGALKATYTLVNATGNIITFKNTYTAASVDHAIEGSKTLHGRTLINDEFSFVLTQLTVDGTAVQNPRSWTAKNLGGGEISFPVITYDKAGTYVYSVEEVVPQGGKAYGITYDTTQYKVTVVVKDNGEGALYIASQTVTLLNNTPANTISFLNKYEADPTWAQFTGNKQLTGKVNNALQGGEFEFELYNANANWERGSLKETVENGAGGTITFTKIDFNTDEDQYFIVVEKNGGQVIDGITYDDTVYHVWVEVADDLKGQLHATVHIYDGDGIPQDKISFVNVYQVTGGANVTLSGEKIIENRVWKNSDSFTFELYEADENYNAAEQAKTSAQVDYATRNYTISLDYTAADVGKTYYYVLTEKNGGMTIDGLTYSGAEYHIKVEVYDDEMGGVGTKVTVVDATTSTLNFVNRYNIVTGTSVQFEATKELNGKDIGNIKFAFELIESNANWDSVKVLQTKENNGASIGFDKIDYTAAGDYYYIIAEQKAGQTIAGITYDDTVYRIQVKVTDNLDGTLSKVVTITKVDGGISTVVDTIAFVNIYSVTGSDAIELTGQKTFEGRDWTENDAFVIELYSADANFENLSASPVAAATVDPVTGKFTITRTYGVNDLGQIFYYVAKEKNAGQRIDGITYSGVQYKVTVTVKDNGDGTVDAAATVEGAANNALNFTNRYSADKTSVTFEGTKTLKTNIGNRELKANDFTFDLYKANDNFVVDGAALQSVKNDKDGKFAFTAEELTEAKVYYFVIKENSQNPIGGVVYDNTQYQITVTVTDNGNGNLTVTNTKIVKVKGTTSEATQAIAFVNEYNAAVANVTIQGDKKLSGRDLVDGEFKFLMTEADASFNALAGATPMVAFNADGKFSFDALSFTKVGSYYFVISEDTTVDAERVSFDDAMYFVTIRITDDENGKLIASDPVIVKKGSTAAVETIEFTNVFVPKPADITVSIDITKTVVNKGTDTIGPDDFEFLLKNLADGVDGITVKSDKDGKAKFALTFTEDDIGKIYSYKLTEVDSGRHGVTYSKAEYAITVAITLDKATNTLVATLTQNETAVTKLAAAFENTYDVDIPDNPQTGDPTNLAMWLALMLVSGGAALSLCIYDNKKRRQKNA